MISMNPTAKRKVEHLKVCLEKDTQARSVETGFGELHFVHRCLLNAALDEVDVSTRFLGKEFGAPLFISAMTGGADETASVNGTIATVVEEFQIGMCVGSQRAGIEDPSLEHTYRIARERAPSAFLSANLGIAELLRYEPEKIASAVEMIEADALTIHLNPLQEHLQPEGTHIGSGSEEKIGDCARYLRVPLILKETGAGISREDALGMQQAGVKGIEVAGAGGTSWAAVEHYRSLEAGDRKRAALARTFWDWGIPTVASLLEVCTVKGLEVVGSGGMTNGIEVTKALALGATLGGIAHRVLRPAVEGVQRLRDELEIITDEVRVAMALVGARRIQDLRAVPIIISGSTAEWARQRDIAFTRR